MKEDKSFRFELVKKVLVKDKDGNIIGEKSVSKKFRDGNQMFYWATKNTNWKFEAKKPRK